MIFVKTHDGRITMEVMSSNNLTIDASDARELLRLLHKSTGPAYVRYPALDNKWFPFNNMKIERKEMDIQRELLRAGKEQADAPNLKIILVSPATDELPDDGMLNYQRIATVFDLRDVPSRSVVQFDETQLHMLKMIVDNAALLGLEVRTLIGLPKAEYTMGFEDVTGMVEKVAYAPFMTDLRLEKETAEQLAASEMTEYDRERTRVERKDGSVKIHSADVASLDDDEEIE